MFKNMSQKNRILLLAGLIVLLGVAIYLVQVFTPARKEKLPEKVEFKASTITGAKEITFKYIPQTVEEAAYTVSYEVTEGTSTLEAVQEKHMEKISAENPIAINVLRKATSTYAIEMTIKDAQERIVYQGTLSVKPKRKKMKKKPPQFKPLEEKQSGAMFQNMAECKLPVHLSEHESFTRGKKGGSSF